MADILAFAGSNSSTSINYKLVQYTATLIKDHKVRVLNMANYPFPMYSKDYEEEKGYSNSLVELKNDLQHVDGLLLSVNEHNGNPSAYTKNLLDWLSRLELKFLMDKKILLMATSGGKRGAAGSLEVVEKLLPRFGATITATFSLPSFYQNFDKEKGITDEVKAREHHQALQTFSAKL